MYAAESIWGADSPSTPVLISRSLSQVIEPGYLRFSVD